MRINGDKNINSLARSSQRRADPASNIFRLDESGKAEQPGSVRTAPAVSGIEALLALQGVGSAAGSGARIRHGHDMLDLLEDLKIGLLSGDIPSGKLERLIDNLKRRPTRMEGEAVEHVLDEIELRARVELAKLGREAA